MRYDAPTTINDAVKLLAGKTGVAPVLAGGTDLLVPIRTDGDAANLPVYVKRTPRRRRGDADLRFIPRSEMDIAVVGAGVSLTLDAKGVCTAARVALGAVAERVLLVPEAAAALVGSTVDETALERLAAAASAACRPID